MKKYLLIVTILLCFSVNKSFSQPWLYQYFDGADTSYYNSVIVDIDTITTVGNLWQVGKPQKTIFDSAATLPNVIVTDTINNYPINNSSSFTFNVAPFMTYGILGIQWKQKLDMDKKQDGGMVEFSVDYGATWQSAFNNPYVYNFFGYPMATFDTLVSGEYAFSGTDSTWQDVWLCYDMSWIMGTADSIKVRFTFISDSIDNNREGWMIDNLNSHVTIGHPVKENAKKDYINVYPNPAKNIINIELEKIQSFHIIENMELIDASGKTIKQWKNIPTRYWIDVSNYPNGIYYLKIKSNIKSQTVPITIQK